VKAAEERKERKRRKERTVYYHEGVEAIELVVCLA
jgi:hypothetical protein